MKKIFTAVTGIAIAIAANAQVNVKVHETAEDQPVIAKEIYGQFAEHLGRCIYDGIWVGKDSPVPNINGFRTEIVEKLKGKIAQATSLTATMT